MSKLGRFVAKVRRTLDPLQGLDEQQWLRTVATQSPAAIGVVEPTWRGVYSSMANLFPVCLGVLDGLTKRSATYIADLIAQSGVERVVFAEFPKTYIHLLDALERVGRKIDVYTIWYNAFMMLNDRHWERLCTIRQLAEAGRIRKIGFAKSGMAEVFEHLGVPSAFVLHAIEKTPREASEPMAGGPHLGVAAVNLAIWRKLPFAMLAATTEIPGAVVHVAGANRLVEEYSRGLRINAQIQREPVPQVDMPQHLSSMHLNLYVTLCECCPMLPLESLSEGAPCLLGPNSHLFEDSSYLRSRLVVEYPERNEVIADAIRQALEERDDIIAAYRRWAPTNWLRCQESVADLLDVQGVAMPLRIAA